MASTVHRYLGTLGTRRVRSAIIMCQPRPWPLLTRDGPARLNGACQHQTASPRLQPPCPVRPLRFTLCRTPLTQGTTSGPLALPFGRVPYLRRHSTVLYPRVVDSCKVPFRYTIRVLDSGYSATSMYLYLYCMTHGAQRAYAPPRPPPPWVQWAPRRPPQLLREAECGAARRGDSARRP